MKRLTLVVALFAVLPFALAACGGGNSTSGTATRTNGTSTRAPSPAATMAPGMNMSPTAGMTMAAGTMTSTTPGAGGAPGAIISVTENDFSIMTDKQSAPAGQVQFNVQNNGPSVHEFMLYRTDLAPDQLPQDSTTAVVQEGPGVVNVAMTDNIAPNGNTTLTAQLTPGRYVLACNLPTHYQLGMRMGFSVQ